MSEQFEVLTERPDNDGRGQKNALTAALIATADTKGALRLTLNGDSRQTLTMRLTQRIKRHGFRLRSKSDRDKLHIIVWAERMDKASPASNPANQE